MNTTESQFMALVVKLGTDRAETLIRSLTERKSVIIAGAPTPTPLHRPGPKASDQSAYAKVVSYLQSKNRHSASLTEIADRVGYGKNYISCVMHKLVKEGRISRTNRACYIFVR